MKYRSCALCLSLVVLTVSPAFAGERAFPVTDVVILQQPGRDDCRLLLRCEGLDSLAADRVDVANLVIPTVELSDGVTLDVYPITESWTPGAVSWDGTWAAIGTSSPRSRGGRALLPAGNGGGRARTVPVTRYVRYAAAGDVADHGLLLRASTRGSLSESDAEALADQLRSARIVVLLAD